MTRGIVIYALKKPSYGKLAWNLAVSIKRHCDLPIAVIHDHSALSHLQDWHLKFFDHMIPMDHEDMHNGPKFSPGKAKLSGYKYFPFDETMIIDADSICVNDPSHIFEVCKQKNIYSQAVGSWTEEAEDWGCQWMRLKMVKEVFPLPEQFRIFEINSSIMVIKKSEQAEKYYAQALENYIKGNGHPKVRPWGGGFPDELAFNVAFAQLGIEPNFDHQPIESLNNGSQWPIFFSTKFTNTWSFVHENYHFIGFFGDKHFTDSSLQKQYDVYMRGHGEHFGFQHIFKIHHLMKEKHVLSK